MLILCLKKHLRYDTRHKSFYFYARHEHFNYFDKRHESLFLMRDIKIYIFTFRDPQYEC